MATVWLLCISDDNPVHDQQNPHSLYNNLILTSPHVNIRNGKKSSEEHMLFYVSMCDTID